MKVVSCISIVHNVVETDLIGIYPAVHTHIKKYSDPRIIFMDPNGSMYTNEPFYNGLSTL